MNEQQPSGPKLTPEQEANLQRHLKNQKRGRKRESKNKAATWGQQVLVFLIIPLFGSLFIGGNAEQIVLGLIFVGIPICVIALIWAFIAAMRRGFWK